jgi:hypothetical protein
MVSCEASAAPPWGQRPTVIFIKGSWRSRLRSFSSLWTRPRNVVARLGCSLQFDVGDSASTGMTARQEADIRYLVRSLKGTAQHLYEDLYFQQGQTENLIKVHKAHLP